MRYLEVRRHTMRHRPGKHLTQAGVTLARVCGASMGPFERVVTSKLPRAYETAIAMGFAVDGRIELLGSIGDKVVEEFDWTEGFPAVSRAMNRGKQTARYAAELARCWEEILAGLRDGGCALIVSHGGIIEAGAAGCLPEHDHAAWGRALDYCEGVRLAFENGRFTDMEIIRLTNTPIDDRIALLSDPGSR
jgi:broad specificity phosphatase PhoE